ncbi:MAG: TRAP transporter large permease subunit [Chloroflexi bacterium]|nr:TRAP transporter large permease subunit [Chloroflexota bacterium]
MYGYHFLSLFAVVGMMLAGMTPILAVFWSTVLALLTSYIRRDTRITPPRLYAALAEGSRGVLSVAATTAAAGIIVGVVTLTGLGLKLAGGSLFLIVGGLFLIYPGSLGEPVGLGMAALALGSQWRRGRKERQATRAAL